MTIREHDAAEAAAAAATPLPRSRAPEAQGIASSALLAFVDAADRNLRELHSFMLLRHGQVAAEGWWTPYGPQHPHLLFSLSKSFTATAAGLAIAEGLLSLDDAVLPFFPADAPAQPSENLAAMRLRHLLSMSTGHAQDTLDALFAREDGRWAAAFLEQPVEHAPGTHFVYNSGATYLISAIVQKVTGTTVQEYLRPRLFAPLGIAADVPWENCPRGINVGGWGLSLRTEDIARFGQLYLQDGVWNGQRVLPEGWVTEATARQVSNGDKPDSDWSQGYGYQFWRSRHGAYRGDGAFGQFCIVLPEQDAVLAFTAGIGDMQAALNLVWEHLLPAFGPAPLPEDRSAHERLRRRLAGLALRPPQGQPDSPRAAAVSGSTYRFEANEHKIESVTLDFGPDKCLLLIRDDRGEHPLACGIGGAWLRGATTLEGSMPRRVAASGAWADDDTFAAKLCYYETPFSPTITCRFADDRLLLDYSPNVSFGPAEVPQLVGRTDIVPPSPRRGEAPA